MTGTKAALSFLLVFLLPSLAHSDTPPSPQTHVSSAEKSGPDFRAEVEKQAFLLVNQYRKENDLPPLAWDEAIAKSARGHSKDMATGEVDFGHEGFRDRIGQLKDVLHGVWGAGENVYMSSDLDDAAKKAVTTWLHSPHHLENIRGDYNCSGMGVWQDKDGVIYFTQIFLKVKAPAAEVEQSTSVGTTLGLLMSPAARGGH